MTYRQAIDFYTHFVNGHFTELFSQMQLFFVDLLRLSVNYLQNNNNFDTFFLILKFLGLETESFNPFITRLVLLKMSPHPLVLSKGYFIGITKDTFITLVN